MINIPPIKSSSSIKPELLAEISKTWRVGQLLSATTKQGGDALSKVLIQVGQHTLESRTPIELKTGQDIKLLVKSAGINQFDSRGNIKTVQLPLLSILTQDTAEQSLNPPGKSTSVDLNHLASTKLRLFIAVQQSLSQLMQSTQPLLKQVEYRQKLSAPLKNWLSNLNNNLLPDNKKLSAAQIKQYVINSGIFLESKLLKQFASSGAGSQNTEKLTNDFKFQLLAIKAELAQFNDMAVKQKVDQAGITTQQLSQLKTDILKLVNKPEVLLNKLLSVLPKPQLTQLLSLVSSTGSKTPITDDMLELGQALSRALQQTQSDNQKKLIEQLRFRVLLLDLGQQVEQSISKITSQQLQPLSREADGLVLLLFNLIFKDSHEHFDLGFRFQQEENPGSTEQQGWKVTLTFNFKTLGTIQSNIHLIDNQVSTVFHTELTTTADKLIPLLPLLKKGFQTAGLEVLNIDVVKGLAKDSSVISKRINLIDENA